MPSDGASARFDSISLVYNVTHVAIDSRRKKSIGASVFDGDLRVVNKFVLGAPFPQTHFL